ncbi:MAG: hypothetical protein HQL06_04710 [Nitrospirae bacterium]|nr:hypothetical protein [Nitrospirota bacterium]
MAKINTPINTENNLARLISNPAIKLGIDTDLNGRKKIYKIVKMKITCSLYLI